MRVYSCYEKSFQDLPIMGKKTRVIIENRKIFCDNLDSSSIAASRTLKDGIADAGKSIICKLL